MQTILNYGGHVSDSARRAYGERPVTAPRRAIADAADRMRGAFTVDDLAESLRQNAVDAATATVYRAVAAMEATRYVERVGAREGSVLYARCSAMTHHHHIVCDGCGRTEPTPCPPQLATVSAQGFVVTRHEITLYGLCPECANRREES